MTSQIHFILVGLEDGGPFAGKELDRQTVTVDYHLTWRPSSLLDVLLRRQHEPRVQIICRYQDRTLGDIHNLDGTMTIYQPTPVIDYG